MKLPTRHQWLSAAVGVFLAVGLVLTNIWLVARQGGGEDTPPPAGAPAATSPSTAHSTSSGTSSPGASPAMMTVKVYFHHGSGDYPTKVAAMTRTVPRSAKVATAALTQLLTGPTSAERDAGYWSQFSSATSGKLRSVHVTGFIGYADFRDLRPVMPSAGSSAGTAALLAELDATFKQFGNVRRTVYSLDGDVAAFYEWLQLSPPEGTGPTLTEARRVARTFLTDVVGMHNLVCTGSRWRSDFIATVDFRTGTGPISQVALGKGKTSFGVLDVITDTIRVDQPAAAISPSYLAVVTSPLTISGEALAFEGAVNIRVVQVDKGVVHRLGTGHVTGGGDVMRPFTGQITFAQPSTDVGWVLAAELSARDGAVTKVTAVRVAFTHLSS